MTGARLGFRLLSVVLLAASFVACQQHQQQDSQLEELYFPIEGSVGFDILRAGSSPGVQSWDATYLDREGKTTKFRIELPVDAGDASFSSSGQGKFLAEAGSDPIPLLESLKTALQAKHLPRSAQKVDVLTFNFVVAGQHQSRSPKGLSGNPAGNWRSLAISFAKGKGELLLNINPVIHKAEFSIRNPADADRALAELAKVL
ncbi:MAG TPA: hypothetical protein VMT28_02020 [Terriglobales bacterium]|nr:hypothetical protein [Terriglobales bacterium]